MPYEEHECFQTIPDESIIWRYMDFTKFVSLLETQKLFFAPPTSFNDPFECSVTLPTLALRTFALKDFCENDLELKTAQQGMSEAGKNASKLLGINCWHINAVESAAMWKLYLSSNEGIAIQTTFGRLKKAFELEKAPVYIGKVKYINYEQDIIPERNIFFRALAKRQSFEHEVELRAIVFLSRVPEATTSGAYINVDINTLIEKVYVEPTAPEWFRELIEKVLNRYSINKELKYSELRKDPVY